MIKLIFLFIEFAIDEWANNAPFKSDNQLLKNYKARLNKTNND